MSIININALTAAEHSTKIEPLKMSKQTLYYFSKILTKSLSLFIFRRRNKERSIGKKKFRNGKWVTIRQKAIKRIGPTILRVRFEKNHQKPHFHIEYKQEYSGSYRLPDCTRWEGYIPVKKEREMLVWAQKNVSKIMSEWDELYKANQW